ncbi:MAG TPA: ParB/RepB/Spo0J family partition protein [Thermomicrobiales bacterium]|nr:ParB/RepB/Spo0J family partition protein [Thermomicrobiales bacterium]
MPELAGATPRAANGQSTRRKRFTVDALFADHRPQAVGVADLTNAKEIQLDRIEPDPEQPRRTFDANKLAELTGSIRREGVLQPIAVRYDVDRDVYVVLHGERRWRAARDAGLASIPAIVRDVPADRRLLQQLMENIVRDDLNAVDRAAALRSLKARLGDATWETVAEAVGIRRSRLFQLLGTEKLPEPARDDIRAGRLSEKQSRALQGLPPGHQEALRAAIVADDLPAAEAMRLARSLRAAHLPDDAAVATRAMRNWRVTEAAPNDEPKAARSPTRPAPADATNLITDIESLTARLEASDAIIAADPALGAALATLRDAIDIVLPRPSPPVALPLRQARGDAPLAYRTRRGAEGEGARRGE